MFAVGEEKSHVCFSKVYVPRGYDLRRKGRRVYGVWVGTRKLYLSDEIVALKSKGSHNSIIFNVHINAESQIEVPSYLDKKNAMIRGCITTIEIEFEE